MWFGACVLSGCMNNVRNAGSGSWLFLVCVCACVSLCHYSNHFKGKRFIVRVHRGKTAG